MCLLRADRWLLSDTCTAPRRCLAASAVAPKFRPTARTDYPSNIIDHVLLPTQFIAELTPRSFSPWRPVAMCATSSDCPRAALLRRLRSRNDLSQQDPAAGRYVCSISTTLPLHDKKSYLTCTPGVEGVAREVAALYGERPPPVAVYEEKKTYRAKRQSTGPAKKWYRLTRNSEVESC